MLCIRVRITRHPKLELLGRAESGLGRPHGWVCASVAIQMPSPTDVRVLEYSERSGFRGDEWDVK
jgi:hypothetical protein